MKTVLIFRSFCIALVVLFGLQSCGDEEVYKVGLLLGDSSQERWQQDQTFFVNKVQEMGGQALVYNASNDANKQLEQAKQLLDDGVSVLVVVPVDGEAAGLIVEAAHEAGVKVMAYDRIITNSALDYYISFNNVRVGELQAKYVSKKAKSGNYVIISGPVSDNNSLLFKEGQLNVLSKLEEAGDINIVFDEYVAKWDDRLAYELMIQALDQTEGDVDVVMAANDDLASGVQRALRERGLLGQVLVTGQDADLDACKAILAGNQAMTVYKPIQALANAAAIGAMSIAEFGMTRGMDDKVNNGYGEISSMLLTPIPVDEENMRSNVIADGFHLESALYSEGSN